MFKLSIDTIIPAPTNKREVSVQNLQMSGKVWSHDTLVIKIVYMYACRYTKSYRFLLQINVTELHTCNSKMKISTA